MTLLKGTQIALSLLYMATTNPSAAAIGDLMIFPKRLIFEGPKHSDILTLTNVGHDSSTFEISMVQYRMKPDGDLQEISTPEPGQLFADKFVRFYPKQMTLAPGESQTVRVQVRGLSDAEDGEYRSHLIFRAVPTPQMAKIDTVKKNSDSTDGALLSFHIDIRYALSIPIILRKGDLTADAKISVQSTKNDSITNIPKTLILSLQRSGTRSLYGSVDVYFRPSDGGKDIHLNTLFGLALYTPNLVREIDAPLKWPEGTHPVPGKYVVAFHQGNEPQDPVIASGELAVISPPVVTGK